MALSSQDFPNTTAESSLNVEDFSAKAEGDEWANSAADIFRRHGFCIVLDALTFEEVSEVLQTCLDAETDILRLDPDRLGCRDPGRYSFGAASESGHMLHHPAWRHLLQSRSMLLVLQQIFPAGFIFCGGGGDFVRGGTLNYQSLHSDLGPSRVPPEHRSDNPPPMISVNFTVQTITADNGPMRVIPGRKVISGKTDSPPHFPDEPEVLRQSKLFPLPLGAAIIRDLRLWHGGTPNCSPETRFLPSVEIMSMGYSTYMAGPHSFGDQYCDVCKWHRCSILYRYPVRCLPDDIFQRLAPEVQKLCESVHATGQVLTGFRNFARAQRSWETEWKRQSRGGALQSTEASWQREKSERFVSFKEGISATGTVLAKTARIALGLFLIVKALRVMNAFSMALEQAACSAKLTLLKALPPAASVFLTKLMGVLAYL
ncbi:unnamed protein product [Durusdinium trenchii]|uniref:Phytanoyl-CoA dioxygenase family protein n=1 Tax=Durusdinium trenchii TaxID=1381693 RepID=A0ABP0Q1E0_9DINO